MFDIFFEISCCVFLSVPLFTSVILFGTFTIQYHMLVKTSTLNPCYVLNFSLLYTSEGPF
jgi:hypothetical protein